MREKQMIIVLLSLFLLASSCFVAQAQTPSTNVASTTNPSEVAALNSIFGKWGIPAANATAAGWNISGEVCSGVATNSTTDLTKLDLGIRCNCSDRSGTLCHITGLRVYERDIKGAIPDELWNLTFLTDLDLGLNYLSGQLPASVGRLTRMQNLVFEHNNLTGELPKELGNLTDLRKLAIGTNNFSGSLPAELGKLTRLQYLYMDSCGVSGPIPSTFASLRDLKAMWVSDNALTGPIPDFIGSFSQLDNLRFHGNSFEGGIPSSFSNLTSLLELRISDLSNGSSSLDFIGKLKSLTTLVLRHNGISGSVPSNIEEYRNLTLLDLSFNNLTGQIPDSLFDQSSLKHLFLGNNKLTGPLPARKTSSLQTIDLSYNELSGSFPSWVRERLQLNLVANNFTVSDSNSSGLPSGLNCLQRNFPCNRESRKYSSFAIKCGGTQLTSSDGIVYESDNETLGPATYYVTNTTRWAVSNVGLPSGTDNPQYKTLSASEFTRTMDPELFETARVSAGSLRYYGLDLENGNYNVSLQFAESAIVQFGQSTIFNPSTWSNLRRRIFDIYIQGNRVLKDFDIWKETGGASIQPVRKNFQVRVSENYLEIHLFWAGKGTCCVPHPGTYGPSISAISAIRVSEPNDANKDRTGLIVGIAVPVGILGFMALFAAYYIVQRRKGKPAYDDEEFLGMDAKPYIFSYAELKAATDDFKPAHKLGEGGFGAVFKGTLDDGRVVAIKQLSVASPHGKSQFVAEIATISAVQHRNLVKLYGCCIEGDKRLLVYEYLENNSLDKALFGKTGLNLNWPTRFDICLGVAKGLAYLHEESRLRIVHRDVKASNILLDIDLTPKISDFGLAKLYDDKKTHISTRVAGTIGYLAPEYALWGQLTEKADVFGFGVVALEIISGRPNFSSRTLPNSDNTILEEDKIYLLELAWQLHEDNRGIELVDTNLSKLNEDEAKRVMGVALLCTQPSPGLRPSMSRVVAMLSGDIEVPVVTSRPAYLTDWKFKDTSSLFSDAPSTDFSNYASTSTSTSTKATTPTVTQPTLSETIDEGR